MTPKVRFRTQIGLIFAFVLMMIAVQRILYDFAITSYPFVPTREFEKMLRTKIRRYNETLPLCPILPEVNSVSRKALIDIPREFWTTENFELDEKAFSQLYALELGGSWSPSTCLAVHHVAIILPFRDRYSQLKKLLMYMHRFLQMQLISYRIYAIEQKDELPFNRGKLYNIGFNMSARDDPELECFIFQEVDMIPEFLFNVYGCSNSPRHMSTVTSSSRYTMNHPNYVGGALAITKEVFLAIQGFSNNREWGDLNDKLRSKGIKTVRLSPAISSYRVIPYKRERDSSDLELRKVSKGRIEPGELDDLKFVVVNHISSPLYTLIQVNL